jgi:hypothetical protein
MQSQVGAALEMFGTILFSFYGHGQASSSMMDMNSDLIDLCMASGESEQGWSRPSQNSNNAPLADADQHSEMSRGTHFQNLHTPGNSRN